MPRMDQPKLRTAHEPDSEFVYAVKKTAFLTYVEKQYGSWDEQEQRRYHQARFAAQDFRIVSVDGLDVGILAVEIDSDALKVNQLMILSEFQGRGIGERSMMQVIWEAKALNLPVRLQVMKVNPRALAFYRRLGFEVTGETATHLQLESACTTLATPGRAGG